ncbi:RES family NAD+ phosphorylase [Caballeronia sp. HLA56]
MTFSVPIAPAGANFKTITLKPDDVQHWYHVYSTEWHPNTATTFAQGWGDTRFAPIYQENGAPVHTYYAANGVECAILESVLHDIVLEAPSAFSLDRLQHFWIATIDIPSALDLVSFHTAHLPALELSRAQLIDSLPTHYSKTRTWSQAAYREVPHAQGIAYGSRRYDANRCVMLFEQRLDMPPFRVVEDRSLALEPRRSEVIKLLRELDIPVA